MNELKNAPFFYCPPERIQGDRLILPPDESQHLSRVLRKKPGELIRVTDGCGHLFVSRVEVIDGRSTQCTIVERSPGQDMHPVSVVLVVSMIRKERFEWLIEKAAEIGVAGIIPLRTDRTEPRAGGDRRDRWRKIALSSMKQSRRTRAPQIDAPIDLRTYLGKPVPAGLCLLADPNGGKTIASALKGTGRPSEVRVLVGPEGGLSTEESAAAEQSGFVPVRLASAILRAETACIVAATLVIHRTETWVPDPVAT